MIDCDMYSSTKDALNFCTKLIKDEAIIFFDGWNRFNLAEKNLGEKKAFTEFLNENPQFKAEEFGSYSYKLKENGKVFKIIKQN
jgi:O-methyltransferase